jgi:RNA polymerase sigma-70 factor (sigma-E family)
MHPPSIWRRDRDDEAFSAWVDRHGQQLLRTAYLLTGDRHRAEDLVQAVLLRALPRWGSIGTRAPMAYLRRALVNQNTDTWRRTGSRETLTAIPSDVPVNDNTAGLALRQDLLAALQTLPTQQRAAVVLRYFEDLPDHEIAELLGCAEGTVRSQVSRALVKLRPHLHDHYATHERCTS